MRSETAILYCLHVDVHLDTSHLLCCVRHCCWDTILMFVFKYCIKMTITADKLMNFISRVTAGAFHVTR